MITQTRIVNTLSLPSLIQTVGGFANSTSFVITPPTTALAGSVLIVCWGGSTSGTPTAPSGWVELPVSSANVAMRVFAKTAGASEPATYTFTWSSALNGAYTYMEYTGAEPYSEQITIVPNTGLLTSSTSYSDTFDIPGVGVACSMIGKLPGTTIWNVSAPWFKIDGGVMQQLALKNYTDAQIGDSVTWSGSAAPISYAMFFIKAKEIRL